MAGVNDFRDLSNVVVEGGNKMRTSLTEAVAAAREMDKILDAVSKQQARSSRIAASYDTAIKKTSEKFKAVSTQASDARDTIRSMTTSFDAARKAVDGFGDAVKTTAGNLRQLAGIDVSMKGLAKATKDMEGLAKAAQSMNKVQRESVSLSRRQSVSMRKMSDGFWDVRDYSKGVVRNFRALNQQMKSGRKLGQSFQNAVGGIGSDANVNINVEAEGIDKIHNALDELHKEMQDDAEIEVRVDIRQLDEASKRLEEFHEILMRSLEAEINIDDSGLDRLSSRLANLGTGEKVSVGGKTSTHKKARTGASSVDDMVFAIRESTDATNEIAVSLESKTKGVGQKDQTFDYFNAASKDKGYRKQVKKQISVADKQAKSGERALKESIRQSRSDVEIAELTAKEHKVPTLKSPKGPKGIAAKKEMAGVVDELEGSNDSLKDLARAAVNTARDIAAFAAAALKRGSIYTHDIKTEKALGKVMTHLGGIKSAVVSLETAINKLKMSPTAAPSVAPAGTHSAATPSTRDDYDEMDDLPTKVGTDFVSKIREAMQSANRLVRREGSSMAKNMADAMGKVNAVVNLKKLGAMRSIFDDLDKGAKMMIDAWMEAGVSFEEAFAQVTKDMPEVKKELADVAEEAEKFAKKDLSFNFANDWDKQIRDIGKKISGLKSAMSKKGVSFFDKQAMKKELVSLSQQLQKFKTFKDLSADMELNEKVQLQNAKAAGTLNSAMEALIASSDEYTNILEGEMEAAKQAAESESSLDRAMNKHYSILAQLNKRVKEGEEEARKFAGGVERVGNKGYAAALAIGFVATKLGEMAGAMRSAVLELKKFNIETSLMAETTAIGISSDELNRTRKALSMTREEALEFYKILKVGSESGVVSTQELVDAAGKLRSAFGGAQLKRLEEYVSLLKEFPTLDVDLAVNAKMDDKAAAIFKMAKEGKMSSVIELQTAGLMGGIRKDITSKSDVKSLNVAQSIESSIQSMWDSMRQHFPDFAMNLSAIAENSKEVTKLLGEALMIWGGLKFFGMAKAAASAGAAGGGAATGIVASIAGAFTKGMASLSKSFVSFGAALANNAKIPIWGPLKAGASSFAGALKGSLPTVSGMAKAARGASDALMKFKMSAGGAGVVLGVVGEAMTRAAGTSDDIAASSVRLAGGLLKFGATIATATAAGAALGTVIPGVGNAIGAAVGFVAGLGLAFWAAKDDIGKAVNDLTMNLSDNSDAFKNSGGAAIEFQYQATALSEASAAYRSELLKMQDASHKSGLSLQKTFSLLKSTIESGRYAMYEFNRQMASMDIGILGQMGGSSVAFNTALTTMTSAIDQEFSLMKEALADARKTILSDSSMNAMARRNALNDLHKQELEATKKLVDGIDEIVNAIYKSPDVLGKGLESKIAKAKLEFKVEGNLAPSAEMLKKGIEAMSSGLAEYEAIAGAARQATEAVFTEASKYANESYKKQIEAADMLLKSSSEFAKKAREGGALQSVGEVAEVKMSDVAKLSDEKKRKALAGQRGVGAAEGTIRIDKATLEGDEDLKKQLNVQSYQVVEALILKPEQIAELTKKNNDEAMRLKASIDTINKNLTTPIDQLLSDLNSATAGITMTEKAGPAIKAKMEKAGKKGESEEYKKQEAALAQNSKDAQAYKDKKEKAEEELNKAMGLDASLLPDKNIIFKAVQEKLALGAGDVSKIDKSAMSNMAAPGMQEKAISVANNILNLERQRLALAKQQQDLEQKLDQTTKDGVALADAAKGNADALNKLKDAELRAVEALNTKAREIISQMEQWANWESKELYEAKAILENRKAALAVAAVGGDVMGAIADVQSADLETYKESVKNTREKLKLIEKERDMALASAEALRATGDISGAEKMEVAAQKSKILMATASKALADMAQEMFATTNTFATAMEAMNKGMSGRRLEATTGFSDSLMKLAAYSKDWQSMTVDAQSIAVAAARERYALEVEATKQGEKLAKERQETYLQSLRDAGVGEDEIAKQKIEGDITIEARKQKEFADEITKRKESELQAAKQAADQATRIADLQQQTVDAEANFVSEMGGSFKQFMDLQSQSVALERKKAEIAEKNLEDAVAAGAEGESLMALQSAARLAELKYQQKALGAQKSVYENLIGAAFGSMRDSYGMARNMNSIAMKLGRENTLIKTRSGMYRGAGKGEKIMGIEERAIMGQLESLGGGPDTSSAMTTSFKDLSKVLPQKSDTDKAIEIAKFTAKKDEDIAESTDKGAKAGETLVEKAGGHSLHVADIDGHVMLNTLVGHAATMAGLLETIAGNSTTGATTGVAGASATGGVSDIVGGIADVIQSLFPSVSDLVSFSGKTFDYLSKKSSSKGIRQQLNKGNSIAKESLNKAKDSPSLKAQLVLAQQDVQNSKKQLEILKASKSGMEEIRDATEKTAIAMEKLSTIQDKIRIAEVENPATGGYKDGKPQQALDDVNDLLRPLLSVGELAVAGIDALNALFSGDTGSVKDKVARKTLHHMDGRLVSADRHLKGMENVGSKMGIKSGHLVSSSGGMQGPYKNVKSHFMGAEVRAMKNNFASRGTASESMKKANERAVSQIRSKAAMKRMPKRMSDAASMAEIEDKYGSGIAGNEPRYGKKEQAMFDRISAENEARTKTEETRKAPLKGLGTTPAGSVQSRVLDQIAQSAAKDASDELAKFWEANDRAIDEAMDRDEERYAAQKLAMNTMPRYEEVAATVPDITKALNEPLTLPEEEGYVSGPKDINKMDLPDPNKMDAMADAATVQRSIYTHDISTEEALLGIGKQLESVFQRQTGGLETAPGQAASSMGSFTGGQTGGDAKVAGQVTVKFDNEMFQTAVVDIVGRFVRSGEIRAALVQQGFPNTGVIPGG